MATNNIPQRDFYVYILYREDGTTPFYVGKGRRWRWLIHERTSVDDGTRKTRIIRRMLRNGCFEIPKEKIASDLTDAEAKALEIATITRLGRVPHGTLVNVSRGGDGVADPSPEWRAKVSAANVAAWKDPTIRQRRIDGIRKAFSDPNRRRAMGDAVKAWRSHPEVQTKYISPAFRKKIGAASKAAWEDAERRAKGAAITKQRMSTPEAKEKQRLNWLGRKHTNETRAKMSKTGRGKWQQPEHRAKVSLANKAAKNRPEVRARSREIMLNPELRAKLDAGNALARDKRVAAQVAAFNTPEALARRSAASKAFWAARKVDVIAKRRATAAARKDRQQPELSL